MKNPICSRCKRPLKDPVSIAIGMGPDCRGALSRKGWKFPKPRWKVQGGRPVLVGMIGKIEKPAVHTTEEEVDDEDTDNEHKS